MQLSVENANPTRKRILQTLPRTDTLVDVIDACSRVGTTEGKTTHLAEAMAAALKPLVQQKRGNTSQKCFKCGFPGHLQVQCQVKIAKKGKAPVPSPGFPGVCLRCDKYGHRASECRSQGGWHSAGKREAECGGNRTNSPQEPGTRLDILKSATAGSAGVDLATAVEVTLQSTDVQVVPVANDPLGYGLGALLIGRSSTSKQGIFVPPGLIDADYTGNIGIMVQTLTPPIHIPEGTKLAQLAPFAAKVPNPGSMQRGDGGFGSTGAPQVMFTLPLSGGKPIKPVLPFSIPMEAPCQPKLHCLTRVQMLLLFPHLHGLTLGL
ncbi:hypothetical protein TURU_024876 [Turdus rufiventris]|nr:hypothetical protein TURU_024876 [Turdus rufiventris]